MVKDYPVAESVDQHQHRPDVYHGHGACRRLYQVIQAFTIGGV